MGKKNKNQTNNDLPFHDDDCDCDESKIDWKGYTIKGSDNTEYLIIKLLSVSGSVSTIWLAYAINNIKIKSYNDFYAIKIHFTTECDEGNKEIKVSELLKQKIMLTIQGHYALVECEQKFLKEGKNFTLITQNIDGLFLV